MAIYGSLGDIDLISTDYPSIQPTLDLNFAKTKALDPRITFYRNSLATYTDDKGIIRTVPENVPRFDHDPTTGESLGLLIEESRTNLLTHSEDLNQNLLAGFSTAIRNEVFNISPPIIGGRVWYLTDPNTGTDDYIIKSNNSTPTGDISYSIFVKKLSNSTGSINSHFGNSISWNFDTGTITSNAGNYPATFESYPNGWYRLKFTRTYSGSTQTGININQGYYIGGIQIEAGSFATSYIPTSGSTVTRTADVCYMDGTNFSNWYNSVEGSYFIDFNLKNTSTSDIVILSSPVTSGRYPWLLYRFTEDFWKYYNGVNGVANISTGTTFSSQNKFCISYSSSQGSVSKDGILTLSNNSEISVGSGINANIIKIFSGSTINEFPTSGTIKRFTYYPKRLTNTQLQNLTA